MADQGAEGVLSPWLQRRRFAAALPYLTGRVLDVGCGSGALAGRLKADRYYGTDVDPESLELARSRFPNYVFSSQLPALDERFDTVVALAVIEHDAEPGDFLKRLTAYMRDSNSRLVVTTPHPSMDWIHDVGAAIGLFSKHANEEHEGLLDRATLVRAGAVAGLRLSSYRRFLFSANQIAVFQKEDR
ncbi:class I SAM-dependent methyltransferase [Thioalkalivibrio paradoxus]|uniref:Type 11 methyltransferase n=1 Tax=Thioalkalivibrio paradoxus ARh 1 TaxID=713585 RepID=W0DT11_9GAMM|nr:class I SAM-dependent methyltransferase [Thioalkalivibrio paradoxus]AHF00119.1 hypothetical protein THITH_09850 [Thioalkalivibrio paradoxus ARh 1]